MPEAPILLLGLAAAGWFVLAPLFRRLPVASPPDEDLEAAALRHRVSLEALRDVATDRVAGSLDDAAYAEQLAAAEERAALTRAALGHVPVATQKPPLGRGRGAALLASGLIAVVLLGGSFVPATGIGNVTEVDQVLADAQAVEAARQERIRELLDAFAENPAAVETISSLADEYLAGSTQEDLVRAAVSLQLLIELQPGRADAYERIMTAYLRAGDAANARAAHESYAELETADPVESAFFDGLIALRGENDASAAVAAFERFLQLAPDDARAGMIRGLRDEATEAAP